MTLADKIVVLNGGQIMQVGTPRELYESPDNLFVAQFIGSPKMNVMPCQTDGERFLMPGQGSGKFSPATPGADAVRLGIRPEHITLCDRAEGHCDGTVEVIEDLGADTYLYVSCQEIGNLIVRTRGGSATHKGERVGLGFDESHIHFFDENDIAIR